MKLIIDIPKEKYLYAKNLVNSGKENNPVVLAIGSGIPIPDNATVGEVFCILTGKEPICDTASYFTIDKELWNAPYQKGGK